MVEQVTLYRSPTTAADADELGEWLRGRVDAAVTVEDRLLARFAADDSLPEALAETRVHSPYERETGNTMSRGSGASAGQGSSRSDGPMLGIVRYEERTLADPERGGGVIYDGLGVQDILRERLDSPLDHLHVPFLDRVLGTWGDHDGRWHKRVTVLGQPALLSVPGLYEAPAKPESYYKAKQSHALLAGDAPPREVLEQEVDGEFLVADDPRTTDALKGYVLAAYHYLDTGEAFCESAGCRLYDAHRQPELLEAQLRDPEFCEAHTDPYS